MAIKKGVILTLIILILLAAAGGGVFYLYRKEALVMRSPLLVQEIPVITYLNGEVYYADEETEEWQEPEAGQKLRQGSLLRTGLDGEMDIRLSADTILRLDSNSLMVLEKSTLKNIDLSLKEGRLYGRFHKLFKEQDINVKTETVVAGIRGTDLVFEYSGGESTVYALSGITEVYNPDIKDEKLLLSFQKKTVINRDSSPSPPAQMTASEIRDFQNVLNAIHRETVLLVTRAIRFKADSSEILDSSLPELKRLQEEISRTRYNILIIGHTADLGHAGAQLDLSIKRAQSIKEYLVSQGIDPKRLKVDGYGGTKPIADNRDDEGKALNRRVEFIIME